MSAAAQHATAPIAGANDDDDDGDFADWMSDADTHTHTHARICDPKSTLPSARAVWDELQSQTGFDIDAFAVAADGEVDDYLVIKLIKYLRVCVCECVCESDAIDALKKALKDTAALRAVLEDESWMTANAGVEDDLIPATLDMLADAHEGLGAHSHTHAHTDPHTDTHTDSGARARPIVEDTVARSTARASTTIETHEAELEALRARVATLTAGLAASQSLIHTLMDSAGADSEWADSEGRGDSEGSGDSEGEVEDGRERAARAGGERGAKAARARGPDNDTYYFDSYANYGIHRNMLGDAPRTIAYRNAIEGCKQFFEKRPGGAAVLDVGCGTGILSMFAARAGARAVVGVDASSIAEEARAIVATNGLADRVTVLRGKVEEVDVAGALRSEHSTSSEPNNLRVVDCIVSEWMGYALLYESMLSAVINARDRYLRPGGRLLPSRSTISVAVVSSDDMWREKIGFWNDVYGFDMRRMAGHVLEEPEVEPVPADIIASSACTAIDMDLLRIRDDELDIVDAPFECTVEPSPSGGAERTLHGLALWFDVDFTDAGYEGPTARGGVTFPGRPVAASGATDQGAAADDGDMPPLESVQGAAVATAPGSTSCSLATLSTAPSAPLTHWKQTLLLFPAPIKVPVSTRVAGTISMLRGAVNPREYRFVLHVRTPEHAAFSRNYHMH